MRGGIRLHDAFVHAEVAAIKPHEIGHGALVDGRAMVAIFVGDDVLAGGGAEALAAGGNFRGENSDAILDDHGVLFRERNLHAQLIWHGPATEEHLRALPVFAPRGKIKWEHSLARRGLVAVGAGIEQGADVIGLSEPGGEHQKINAGLLLDVEPEVFRFQKRHELFLTIFREDSVRIAAAGEESAEKHRVILGDGVGDQRRRACFAGGRRGMLAQEKANLFLQVRFQRDLERIPGAGRPLQCGGKFVQNALENFHVAGLESHRQQVAIRGGSHIEVRHAR